MDILLGQIFGSYLLIVGLGMVFNPRFFKKAYLDTKQSVGLQMVTCLVPILVGAAIMAMFPVVYWDWRLSISILGYGLFLLGTLRMMFIKTWFELTERIVGIRYFIAVGVLFALFGGFMAWNAFDLMMLFA